MKFRLKMDLSQFYKDERNLAYILIDPKWDQVICLQQHVQKLFDVPEVQFLTDDGIYIPLRESIDVIKTNDVLRAIIPKEQKKKKKKSKSSEDNSFAVESDACDDSLEINGIKRKCDDEEGLTCSTPNLRPKKKLKKVKEEKNNSSSIIIGDQSSIKELEESSIESLQNSNTVTSTINSKEPNKLNEPKEVFAQPNNVSEDTIKSRKRKRSRKNKKSLEDLEKDEKNNRLSSVPIPISSSTLRLTKSMSTPNNSIKHVHFSDDDGSTLIEENPKSKENLVIYKSLLTMDSEARVIQALEDDTSSSIKKDEKPIIQIHEHIILVPAADKKCSLSTVEPQDDYNCSIIEVDDSVVRSEPDEDIVGNDNCVDITVEKILPLSEELSEMPNVGDVILFKVYQLSEAYTPELSKYICGRCEQIDSTNKTLDCLVLDGLDQLDKNLPRIAPSDESQDKQKEKFNCFQFYFNEMVDKRIFRM